MDNFCTNCETKIKKEDNYCINCGTKIKEDNFCTNCGTKIKKEDNYCVNCGTKIDKSNIKPEKTILKSVTEKMEKKKAEKEESKKKLKMIDEIFESEEIKSEIIKNNIQPKDVKSIKDALKIKIIIYKNMNEEEIKYFIKTELEKIKILQKEISSKKIEETEITHGNYCSLSCRHCYEEFLDSGGGIVGDFDSGGYVEYYCHLGHRVSIGKFCEDYEKK